MRRNVTDVSTKLQRIAELSREDEGLKFTSLAHLLTPEMLKESFLKLNQKASAGVDGISMEEFKRNLDENIDKLWLELRKGKYKAQPVRRSYIEKANGKMRPLGIPSVRDRVVQRAVNEILKAIYEPYFMDFSYGFRPGRSAHDALQTLRKTIDKKPIRWVIDADIEGFFDNVNHHWLREFLKHRIADKTILRLIGKWLKSGVMENGLVFRDENGTPQGGPISPTLANIYLHYVLDLWFERKVKRNARGICELVRYADDFVVCFEYKVDADEFEKELKERFGRFGLKLSEEKTQMIEFGKYASHRSACGPAEKPRTFDFLGFTHYMRKRGKRGYRVAQKPSRKSRNKFLANTKVWLEKCKHTSVWFHARKLKQKLQGFYGYFGLRHSLKTLEHVKWAVERLWMKTLTRRSQRDKTTWEKLKKKAWFKMLPNPKRRY